MTHVSDTEQVMSEDGVTTDSEDEALIKKTTPRKRSMSEEATDSEDEILVKPSAARKLTDPTTTTAEGGEKSPKQTMTVNKMLQLPVSRIKTIMKSSPELANVKPESYILITRATELFVQYLAKRAHETAGDASSRELGYGALSNVVSKDESLDFLEEIVPFKIKMKDYWEKYGYPKPEKEIEVVEICDSNGSSNGHESPTPTSTTPKPLTSKANTLNNTASKTPKSASNSVNNSSQKKQTTGTTKTPLGKTQKTIDSTMKSTTPKGAMVNGVKSATKVTPVNGTQSTVRAPGKGTPEVICIDD